MRHLKSKFIALCLILVFSMANPVQIQTTSQNTVSVNNVIKVEAAKKKATKKKVTKKKTTKKKVVKKNTPKSTTVYVTATGECYHRYACGRGTYYKSTLKSAKSIGLRACKKCY
ncbi:MAG: hypothetical protein E7267_02235 [Lachnospiraceae bacterium]|nr:hypothetical protein [Lachnospiraceae bacterium]